MCLRDIRRNVCPTDNPRIRLLRKDPWRWEMPSFLTPAWIPRVIRQKIPLLQIGPAKGRRSHESDLNFKTKGTEPKYLTETFN